MAGYLDKDRFRVLYVKSKFWFMTRMAIVYFGHPFAGVMWLFVDKEESLWVDRETLLDMALYTTLLHRPVLEVAFCGGHVLHLNLSSHCSSTQSQDYDR
jgi:hypothetical protein